MLVVAGFQVLAELVRREEELGLKAEVRAVAIRPGTLLTARRAVLPFSSCHRPPGGTRDRPFWRYRAPCASGEPSRGWVTPERECQRLSREAENTTLGQGLVRPGARWTPAEGLPTARGSEPRIGMQAGDRVILFIPSHSWAFVIDFTETGLERDVAPG